MSEWEPCIVKLGKISKLENSDLLSITTISGVYKTILKTSDFKEGDLAAFIPYDSVVPDTEFFYFLCPKGKDGPKYELGKVPEKYRTISAKKLRGTYSEGLLVKCPVGFNEGDSIVEFFSLKKRVYEEELDEVYVPGKKAKGFSNQNEKSPKTFTLSKYELTGVGKNTDKLEGCDIIVTEKLEGQNLCMVYAEGKLFVKSRNFWKRKRDTIGDFKFSLNPYYLFSYCKRLFEYFVEEFTDETLSEQSWWRIAQKYKLEKKLKDYKGLAIYGEWYGNLSKFKYDCVGEERDFRVFDIYDVYSKKYLEWDEVVSISEKLGLKTAPVVYRGPYISLDHLLPMAEGKSEIGNHVREGVVIRTTPLCDTGRKIFKLKGKDYKLYKG